ncbi:hypothetical protein FisN_13Lh310 [Fistulifera solaris]|uniref:Transmembrane protein n=1 Tax=Fistulifera solaris TaxID=1519565 RepID=A0A1Z5KLE4_FISSO|nr:hypothetical protein FisN_13Lh310 [Fistulifera solaris]|eukprot:GAX27140.1 hypothetical protein FisN_13Lh310 [Fistulifera solaris]
MIKYIIIYQLLLFLAFLSQSVQPFTVRTHTHDCWSRPLSPLSRTLLHANKNTALDNNNNGEEEEEDPLVIPSYLLTASKSLRRVSWFSWWSQVILTSVSGVILGFARRTLVQRSTALSTGGTSSFFLSGIGLLVSAVSILWTWGNGSRLSRRLVRRSLPRAKAAHMLRRAVQVGVTINLVGLLVHLLAAEEIVGTLALHVLTSSSSRNAMFPEGLVQPLDVLVVQANTNSLLSHFCSLASLLFYTKQIEQVDPPQSSAKEQE